MLVWWVVNSLFPWDLGVSSKEPSSTSSPMLWDSTTNRTGRTE
ncbi:unnamed protein product, partial [Larinioides sclopetarius]